MKNERNSEVIRLLKETDLTYPEIGKRFGISKQRIQQISKANGYDRMELRKINRQGKLQEIAELIKRNPCMSLKEIQEFYNLTHTEMSRFGVFKLHRDIVQERIVNEYLGGATAKEIVNKNYGYTSLTGVYHVINQRKGRDTKKSQYNSKRLLYLERIANLEARNISRKDIARILNDEGFRTVRGKEFNLAIVNYLYKVYLREPVFNPQN